ncbi:MAG: glycosyltransferase family 2 protein [Parvularculaceae bacterium]
MIALLALPLTVAGFAVLAIVIFFMIEVLASGSYQQPLSPPRTPRGRIAVIIPAHNEAAGVAATIASAKSGLRQGDQVLVVADNCTDATADAARAAGAEVIERFDAGHRGKGYALQFGVDHLRADPPETVVFLDADCTPVADAIDRIARLASLHDRPVQALYLAHAAAEAGPASAVSAFAWLLMNRVRMEGLQALGGFSRITGSGAAFPWKLISTRVLATGEIVEDLALTVSLVEVGAAPMLDTGAVVETTLASSASGAATQRARWELGSLRLALRKSGGLMASAVMGKPRNMLMALDLLVPPLTVLAAVIVCGVVASLPLAIAGRGEAFGLFMMAGLFFAAAVSDAWHFDGRKVLPPAALAGLWPYFLSKLRVYGGEGRKSARDWTRTDRGKD